MSTKGWNSLKPITTPDQMSAPIHWNPMNEDWKMRLTKSQIYNTSSGFDTQTLDAMKKLHDKILTFGGDEEESNPEFYKTDFWTKLASWIEANMKGTSVERRQRLYNSYISDRPIQHQLTEYGLIAPDGTWYACEFGEHAALAGRIIMRNREAFGLSDHEVLNMAYDWSGKGLDFLYKRGWIAIRNPSMGNTFLDMDETKTATKAQVNTIFDYISKFNRYDMNISKVMVD